MAWCATEHILFYAGRISRCGSACQDGPASDPMPHTCQVIQYGTVVSVLYAPVQYKSTGMRKDRSQWCSTADREKFYVLCRLVQSIREPSITPRYNTLRNKVTSLVCGRVDYEDETAVE
jgi:hypothetical protein